MSTIDSLQIEIQSNSSNAAQSIQALATSLGNLRDNGKITVAVNNLSKLRNALHSFANVPSSASKIASLASAMERLREVGSVASAASGLGKLRENMAKLGNIDYSALSKVAESSELFKRIASSLGALSSVKSGGLGTMVKSLSQIGKVTDSLDDDTITRFAERVSKLNEKLTPLSQKMTTIQTGLRGINSTARQASGGVNDLNSSVNVGTLNMSNFIVSVQGIISSLQPLIRLLSTTVSDAIEWEGIAARFGRGFGSSAQETYDWIQRLNKEMGINVQQFMQYSSVYATMLTGFGVAVEDAGKMALGYTELTYDIWAGYNDIYKNFADAADAVKSAIAGEVEPIRRAGFTIVESTLEQTAANHGLNISLEKATEAQKSYLRYLTLVDQAQAQSLIGTYASELNTAEGLMRTLAQQVKSLGQAFGSLFLPILTTVIPWVQALVEILIQAVQAIAAFFGFKIQPVTWGGISDGASSVGDLADSADSATGSLGSAAKAAEDLKKATIGIDELNVISPPTQTGGGGGSGGVSGGSAWDSLDVESLWDESIFKDVQNQVDAIKQKFEDLLPVLAGIAAAFLGWRLMHLLDDIDDVDAKLPNLSKTIKGLGKALVIAGISVAVGALVWDFTGAYLESADEKELLKALGTTVLGTALAAFLAGKAGAGIVLVTSGVVTLTRLVVEIAKGNVELSDPEAVTTALVGLVETAIGAALSWKALAPIVGPAFKKLATSVSTWLAGGGAAALSTKIGAALSSIPVWGWIAAAVVGVIALSIVEYDFTDIGRTIGEKVGSAIKWAFENLSPIGLGKKLLTWLKKELDVESIKEAISALFQKETWTEVIFPKIEEIFKSIGEWIKEKVENLAGNIGEFQDGLLEGFGEAFNIDLSSLDFLTVNDVGDLLSMIGGPTMFANLGVEFWAKVKQSIEDAWPSVKSWWGNTTASEKIQVGVKLVKDSWNSVKDWIGKIPVVSQAINLIKSSWSTVKQWIGNIPTLSQAIQLAKSKWSSIKNWIGSIPVVNQAVGLIKSGWKTVKRWIGNIPVLSAGIKLVKSGWTSVKKWLGSLNFKLGFTLPKIGINWGTKEVLGFKISYPKSFYTYAKGGFPDIGEMFVAREAGPEMVGKIGNKTTVANNQQIVEGISEGVYAAVLAAMRASESNGDRAVNVYLDGRQITSAVEQRQRERGSSIMGKQVYSY